MKVFQYPVSRFPFHKWIERSHLNLSLDEDINAFYTYLTNDPNFMELYGKYIKYVSPFFDSYGLKAHPTPMIRFHPCDRTSFHSNFLNDVKTLIYTPLTPMIFTNSFAVESQSGLEDFNFVNMKIGDFYITTSRTIKDDYRNSMGFTSISLISPFL